MDYFLTHKLYAPISAIEKMMIARVRLFKGHGRQPVFVTRDYNREVAPLLGKYGLEDCYLNMFDFFQGVTTQKVQTPAPKIAHDAVQTSADGLQQTLTRDGQVVAVKTLRQADHTLDTVSYYDHHGKVTSIDLYDSRGFWSMTQLLDESGRVVTQLFWNHAHQLVYTEQYGVLEGGQWGNRAMLLRFNGEARRFESLEALFAYFLDQLVLRDPEAIFYADRHETAVVSLSEMANPAVKFLIMHSSHLNDPADPTQVTYWVQKAVDSHFTGIIVSTEKQANDLQKLVPLPVFTVPVRYLTSAELARPRVPQQARPQHTLLVVARLSAEKRVGDAIKALNLVRKQFPDATMAIFGAPMAGYVEQKALVKLVAELGLEKQVHFRGFKDSLDEIYPQGSPMLVTSEVEGFNVSILEALSYGVPVVTYDIDYGPTTLVADGVNGMIVEENTPIAVAQAVIDLWADPEKMAQLSEGAYASCSRYSADAVWGDWARVLRVEG